MTSIARGVGFTDLEYYFDKMSLAVNCLLYALLNRYICDRVTDSTLPKHLKDLEKGVLIFSRSYLRCPNLTIYPSFKEIYVNSPYLSCSCLKKLPTQRVIGCIPRSIHDYSYTTSTPRTIARSTHLHMLSTEGPRQIPNLNKTENIADGSESKGGAWKWILIAMTVLTIIGGMFSLAVWDWCRSGLIRSQIEKYIGADRDYSVNEINLDRFEPDLCSSRESNVYETVDQNCNIPGDIEISLNPGELLNDVCNIQIAPSDQSVSYSSMPELEGPSQISYSSMPGLGNVVDGSISSAEVDEPNWSRITFVSVYFLFQLI